MHQRRTFIPVLFICAMCTLCTTALGGEGEDAESHMSFVMVEYVRPSMMATYEEATKELIGALTEYKIDPHVVNFHTISGPEMGYVYVMSLENFGAMDTMRDGWMGAIGTIGEERWQEMAGRADACVTHRDSFFARTQPELSYQPEHPARGMDEMNFIRYGFYYIIPGHEEKMADVAKRYAALYREHKVAHGWMAYSPVTGNDLPLMVIAHPGTSQSAVMAEMEATRAKLGEAGEALGKEAMSHTRRIELKDGWIRRDLSYPAMDEQAHPQQKGAEHGHSHDHGHGHDHDH